MTNEYPYPPLAATANGYSVSSGSPSSNPENPGPVSLLQAPRRTKSRAASGSFIVFNVELVKSVENNAEEQSCASLHKQVHKTTSAKIQCCFNKTLLCSPVLSVREGSFNASTHTHVCCLTEIQRHLVKFSWYF